MGLVSGENSEKKRKGTIQILCNLFVLAVTELEKTIVKWTPDKEVQFCRRCSKSFNVRRRRHHCRLCGSIMCKKCSIFLLFSEARQCHNPYLHKLFHAYVYTGLIVYDTGRWDPLSVASSKKKRRLQEDSDSDEDEREGVRLCEACDQLMDR